MSSVRPFAFVSAAIGLGGTVAYLAIIMNEGDNSFGATLPFVAIMLGASSLAVVGAFAANRSVAHGVLLTATILFAVIGILGLFTIGIIFVTAAVFSGFASARRRTDQ